MNMIDPELVQDAKVALYCELSVANWRFEDEVYDIEKELPEFLWMLFDYVNLFFGTPTRQTAPQEYVQEYPLDWSYDHYEYLIRKAATYKAWVEALIESDGWFGAIFDLFASPPGELTALTIKNLLFVVWSAGAPDFQIDRPGLANEVIRRNMENALMDEPFKFQIV